MTEQSSGHGGRRRGAGRKADLPARMRASILRACVLDKPYLDAAGKPFSDRTKQLCIALAEVFDGRSDDLDGFLEVVYPYDSEEKEEKDRQSRWDIRGVKDLVDNPEGMEEYEADARAVYQAYTRLEDQKRRATKRPEEVQSAYQALRAEIIRRAPPPCRCVHGHISVQTRTAPRWGDLVFPGATVRDGAAPSAPANPEFTYDCKCAHQHCAECGYADVVGSPTLHPENTVSPLGQEVTHVGGWVCTKCDRAKRR